MEGCQSGPMEQLGKLWLERVSWVRIPPLPPVLKSFLFDAYERIW